MPKLSVNMTVAEALNGLEGLADRLGVESYKEIPETEYFYGDALVSVDACIDVAENEGYVEAEGRIYPEEMEPNARDLAEGIRALMEGDRAMAAALIERALKEWPEAARCVEEIILGRTVRDRRQGALALAA